MKFNEFWLFTKVTARDAVVSYFEPLRVIRAFIAIPFELFRQMFICMMMDSRDFEKLQDIKVRDEIEEMSQEIVEEE